MRKKATIFLLLVASISISYGQSVEQLKSEIEKLKHENKVLQNKADFCDIYSKANQYEVKSFDKNFDVKVLEVIGNKNEQTVDIVFTLKHEIPNQKLTFRGSEFVAYDEIGNTYYLKLMEVAGNKSENYLFPIIPTDQLMQGKITFRNILSKTDRLKKVRAKIETENNDGGGNKATGELELTNLVIQWK